jgi:hypothetical protein
LRSSGSSLGLLMQARNKRRIPAETDTSIVLNILTIDSSVYRAFMGWTLC